MIDINIVYVGAKPIEGYALRCGNTRVTWSTLPVVGSNLYGYLGSYSYFGKQDAPQVLIQGEPVVVLPGEYTLDVFHHFDAVLTLVDWLPPISKKYRRYMHPLFHIGPDPQPIPTVDELRRRYPSNGRKNGVGMVLGNKKSSVPGELYTVRRAMALWFHEHGSLEFDVYGQPPFHDLPNFQRSLEQHEKLDVLASYKYGVCFENSHHAYWTLGYMTERLPEMLMCRTLPTYVGCANIEDYIPTDLFIDYREVGDFDTLNEMLSSMSDAEYAERIKRIDQWIADGNLSAFSMFRLYDQLTEIASELAGVEASMPGDQPDWQPCEKPPHTPIVSARKVDGGKQEYDEFGRLIPRLTVGAEGGSAVPRYWSSEYLASVTLERVTESVERMENGLGEAAPRSIPAARSEVRVRKLLYVGTTLFVGEASICQDFGYMNMLAAWRRYDDLETTHFDQAFEAQLYGVAGMSQRLIDLIERERPDVLFYSPLAPEMDVLEEALGDITEHTDTRTLVWINEDPYETESLSTRWLPHVDCLVTTASSAEERYRELGFGDRVIRSMWAYHPGSYGPRSARKIDAINFVGLMSEMRQQIAQYLRATGLEVDVFGIGWDKNSLLSDARFAMSFSQYLINLNLGGTPPRF
ncbi:MAG: glycosyltransferase family 10 [Candidatus Poribacteria bacterium]|nr:glycosyltransferase family 10 [Candidatus Poribacteria bacterium]